MKEEDLAHNAKVEKLRDFPLLLMMSVGLRQLQLRLQLLLFVLLSNIRNQRKREANL